MVTEAERAVTASPHDAEAFRSLAIAFMRKQRQCGDPGYGRRAIAAIERSLELEPDSYESQKLKAWVLAGQHRFAEARDLARECIQRRPRDPWNYGTLADSQAELGAYPAAVAAVQQMIDLKPGLASYSRAGHMRLLHGDAAGALPLFDLAIDAADPRDSEAIAWVRVQRGDACVAMSRYAAADREYQCALQMQPGYHLGLAGQARCQALMGHREAAIRLYEQALAVIPRPDWAIAMGDLKQAAGDARGSAAAFALARVAMATAGPSADTDRQMALLLADHGDPAAAVAHARRAARERDDVYTDDALAWSLYRDHQYAEAWKVSRRARRLGTQDPMLRQHAAQIAARATGGSRRADRPGWKARVSG
jgi:tetratricopeptide (TPR) repeat protein